MISDRLRRLIERWSLTSAVAPPACLSPFEELVRYGRTLGPQMLQPGDMIGAAELARWERAVAEPWWKELRERARAADLPLRTFVAGDATYASMGIGYVVAVGEVPGAVPLERRRGVAATARRA